MKTADRDMLWDVLAGTVAVLAFVISREITKLYHGHSGHALDDALLLGFLLSSWFVLIVLRWLGFSGLVKGARLWMWLALLVALSVRYGSVVVQGLGAFSAIAIAVCVLSLGSWGSHKASAPIWSGLRRLVAWLPCLIVATPLLVAPWLAEPVQWLEVDRAPVHRRIATVVLLFDEMNAQASAGLQQVMQDHGLQVNFKPVKPVHRSTVEAVPAIFTGQNFKGAQACGLTRVCANGAALDFSQVMVQRSDVDVVGFHHPYCAIQGLRSCQRLITSRSMWEPGRLECSIQRRLGFSLLLDRSSCQEMSHTAWLAMREELISAMLDAPALKQGGVLYAHVPLPHPPAKGTGSLAEQYARNLKQSEALLERVLDHMAMNKIEPRILIFSDHPLRPAIWCGNEAQQFDVPCVVEPALMDDYVPLIVAARSGLPSIKHVESNQQVFDVLRDWLIH